MQIGRPQVSSILEWARANKREFSWRRGLSPYRVLVAELLLRRTTASAVERVFEKFVTKYPDLQALSNADLLSLEEDLSTLGYHKSRSRIIKELATEMLSKYGGIPDSLGSLLSIKQLGLYTAGAILSLGYDRPAPMVDTNVLRILSRLSGSQIKQGEAYDILEDLLPQDFKGFNLSMLDFGAIMCRYKDPLCNVCPLKTSCHYSLKATKA